MTPLASNYTWWSDGNSRSRWQHMSKKRGYKMIWLCAPRDLTIWPKQNECQTSISIINLLIYHYLYVIQYLFVLTMIYVKFISLKVKEVLPIVSNNLDGGSSLTNNFTNKFILQWCPFNASIFTNINPINSINASIFNSSSTVLIWGFP